jgi:hypothetical protein
VTLWQSGGYVFGLAAYVIAGLWGGRPERLGAGVLLVKCLLAIPANALVVRGFYPAYAVMDAATLLTFGWLWFRSDRWWPAVVAAGFGLIVLGHILRLLDTGLSHYAMVSAMVGVEYVTDLALLLGVWERRLAGDAPASAAAWTQAARATAARRKQRGEAGRKETRTVAAAGVAPDRPDRLS